MKSSVRLAGAATLCTALLLTGCAKKTTDESTSGSTTTTTQGAGATSAPAADATVTAAPAAAATTGTHATTNGAGGAAPGGYIDLPVYPGATDAKEAGSLSASTNEGSIVTKAYTTGDDAKKVSDWYKAHLPAAFKNAIMTNDNRTVGTFVDEHTDGDQSVMVTTQDATTTRIQLTTKHGK